MILRRVIEHVKAQNWTAVALDFLIVVVGVLIAFQITEWSGERADRTKAQAATRDLLDESVEIVRELERIVRVFDRYNDTRDRAVAALVSGDAEGISSEDLVRGLTSMGIYPALTLPRDVYDGLVGSGEFSLITDRNARSAIAGYYAELAFFEGQLDYWRLFTVVRYENSHPGIDLIYDPSQRTHLREEVKFDVLAGDQSFVDETVQRLADQLHFQLYRRVLLERAKEMCLALAEAADLPCPAVEAE